MTERLIVDNWAFVIPNASKYATKLEKYFLDILNSYALPGLKTEKIKVKTGLIRGETREYIEVSVERVKDLYRMYVAIRSYGNNLDIQWFLVTTPGLLKQLKANIKMLAGLASSPMQVIYTLKDHELQDVVAFVSSVHVALLEAIEKLLREVNLEMSVPRESKVLKISG